MDVDAASNASMQQFLASWPGMQNPYAMGYGQGISPYQQMYNAGGSAGAASDIWNYGGAGAAAPAPLIAVRVEGLGFHYQLTDDDLRTVFSRYGDVQTVEIQLGGNLAYVRFASMQQALAAIQDLDGKTLSGLKGGTLRVGFDAAASTQNSATAAQIAQRWSQMGAATANAGAYWAAAGAKPFQAGVDDKKYTCKVEFGIDNENEFRVSSKVIGVARRIWKELPTFQHFKGKTRLRGKGSGFLEGPRQQEADEELHLCISCRDHNAFEEAVAMAVREIQQIQREFITHCKTKGLQVPKNLGCKVERQTHVTSEEPQTAAAMPSYITQQH